MSKVMLVEDDDNLREIYEARLAAEGYEIVTAKNGEDALVVAKENRPDLIISDVMMPSISGFDMLDILRNTQGLHDAKVIMLTALGQADDKARAEKLGADRYLVKSQVTLEDIVNAAAELLGGETSATPSSTPEAPAQPTDATAPASPAAAPVSTEPAIPVATPAGTTATAAPDPTPTPQPVAPAEPVAPAPNPTPSTDPVTPAMPQPAPAPGPTTPPTAAPDPVTPTPDPVAASAAPDPSSVALPVAVAPAEPTTPVNPVISMPQTDVTQAPATNTLPPTQPQSATPTSPVSPDPVAETATPAPTQAPANTNQPEQLGNTPAAPAELTQDDLARGAISQDAAIDITKAQTTTNQEATVQQQIDNFVNSAPISTPEHVPDPNAVQADPAPQPEAEVAVAPTEQTAPIAPEPVAQAAAPQAQPTPDTPAPAATGHQSTGGNKIIQPLAPDPTTTPPSLDELVAKEEAVTQQTDAAAQAPTVQPSPIQPGPSVFDPDDPSSVSL